MDGILAENHGAGDTAMGYAAREERGRQRCSSTTSSSRTIPTLPQLPGRQATHLVYLDVWQREVTYRRTPRARGQGHRRGHDRPAADGLAGEVPARTSATSRTTRPRPRSQGGPDATRPSSGRLTTSYVPVGQSKPLRTAANRRLPRARESALSRRDPRRRRPRHSDLQVVERQRVGCHASPSLPGANQLKVDSVGRDEILRFSNGDWIEIPTMRVKRKNLPGELRRIRPGRTAWTTRRRSSPSNGAAVADVGPGAQCAHPALGLGETDSGTGGRGTDRPGEWHRR